MAASARTTQLTWRRGHPVEKGELLSAEQGKGSWADKTMGPTKSKEGGPSSTDNKTVA